MSTAASSRSSSDGKASRRVAYDMLARVLHKRQALDHGHEDLLSSLPDRERAFAFQLVNQAVRRWGSVTALMESLVPKAPPPAVSLVLGLGVTQLCVMRTSSHAAVSETVDLAKSDQNTRPYAKLVNAVLRRIEREGLALPDAPEVPAWLAQRWHQAYGPEVAHTLTRLPREDAPAGLTVNPQRPCPELLGHPAVTRDAHGELSVAPGTDITTLPGFGDGAFWVQNTGARQAAEALDVCRGERVLDLCAAPGGKTLQLAAKGAVVDALDISAKRLERLRQNLERTGLAANLITADARKWQPDAPYEAILLDAPCTATGTLRKSPDVPWVRTPKDLSRLLTVQSELLDQAVGWLAPGGRLLYCTCSLEPEEGEEQITALLKRHRHLQAVSSSAWPQGRQRLMPGEGNTDGFFMALLKS